MERTSQTTGPDRGARLGGFAGWQTALIGKLHAHAGLYPKDVQDTVDQTKSYGFQHVTEVSGKTLSYWMDCAWTRHLRSKGLLEQMRHRFPGLGGHFDYRETVPAPWSREDSMDGFIGTEARTYMTELNPENPSFTHVSFCGPHFPLDPPQEYWEIYRDMDMPEPEGVSDPERIRLWQDRRRAYCAMIHQLDDEVGDLLKVLEEKDILDQTLIVYGTDHGDMMGHRDRGHKSRPEDTSCRTPYVFRFPAAVQSHTEKTSPMGAVDLPPTFLAAAGLDTEHKNLLPGSPGKSYWNYLCGDSKNAPRKTTFAEAGKPGEGWRMVTDGEWKYIHWLDTEKEELFYISEDSFEAVNRIADPDCAAIIRQLRIALIRELGKITSPPFAQSPPIQDPPHLL